MFARHRCEDNEDSTNESDGLGGAAFANVSSNRVLLIESRDPPWKSELKSSRGSGVFQADHDKRG